jgi:hypothetical protein
MAGTKALHPDRARPIHPGRHPAGFAADVRRDLFKKQLRLAGDAYTTVPCNASPRKVVASWWTSVRSPRTVSC